MDISVSTFVENMQNTCIMYHYNSESVDSFIKHDAYTSLFQLQTVISVLFFTWQIKNK